MYMPKGVIEDPVAQFQERARVGESNMHAVLMLHRRRAQEPLSPAPVLLLPV
jgi:hypothetical protein